MGWMDRILGRPVVVTPNIDAPHSGPAHIAVAADSSTLDVTTAYTDRNITFSGCLKGFDYDRILMNKQNYQNMLQLFKLSDYFTDADEIIRGIIKEAYVPFACADRWRLVGADEAIRSRYEEYYKRIDLLSFMNSFFLQYFKYANVYVYRMPNGRLITLPVHLVRIEGIAVDGEPVIDFNCRSVYEIMLDRYGATTLQKYIDDGTLAVRLAAYPPEVAEGVTSRMGYVQLDPANTFVCQDAKEEWVQYATPFIASCLKTLAKKALISDYEDSRLRLGSRGFVLATYGDNKAESLPTAEDLNNVGRMMMNAIQNSGLAVGNNLLKAEFIQGDMRDLFEFDAYKNVNLALLNAGGLSSIVVTGQAGTGSSFGTAQLNIQTAALRIKQAKDDFARMMNKINMRLNGRGYMPHAAPGRIPEFTFPPTDLSGSKAFQETCLKLWDKGLLSNRSLMESYGMDVEQEASRRKAEMSAGYDEVFVAPSKRGAETEAADSSEGSTVIGRPTLDDSERNSDVGNSITGRQPKPSNPEGSAPQETG